MAADVNIKSFKVGDEDIIYIGKKEFPIGQLSTKKDEVEQLLWEKNWHTKKVAMTSCFNKLFKYPKVKRGPAYKEKVKDFSRNSETLIDVFCYDEKKRSEIEKSFQLKMTK